MEPLKALRTKLFGEMSRELWVFFLLIAVVALGNGLGDSILSNYFKDAYNVDAAQRAFIEFPRELPGVLCVFVIGGLSFLGDIRLAFVAQVLACIGITILGLFSPSFAVMLIFLFTYSMGMHLFMPLSDSIGMALAEPDRVGVRVGQYGSVRTAIGFLTGILTFLGFYFGWFSFKTPLKWPFLVAGVAFFIAIILAFVLMKRTHGHAAFKKQAKFSLLFRKEYRFYYMLTILHGVQKQVAFVFGSWVIIDLLLKGADVMSILTIVGSFLGIFFFRYVGKWIDNRGVKFVMYLDALSFIIIYIIYGVVVWLIVDQIVPTSSWMVAVVYLLFILDRLSMQVGVVKSVYLKKIAIKPEDITPCLSTGISLDHIVSILAAQVSGFVWMTFGAHWVFFMAAFLSLGNLFVASRIKEE